MSKTAKLFTSGGSQAVRLPAEFRFPGTQVYVRRDPLSGDIILSSGPRSSWREFMSARARLAPLPDDFLAPRNQSSQDRNPFEDWTE